jgi:hypothetical protein
MCAWGQNLRNVITITCNRPNPGYLQPKGNGSRVIMENLGKRTTLTLAAVFLLATLGWYCWIRANGAATASHYCTYQAAKITCTQT